MWLTLKLKRGVRISKIKLRKQHLAKRLEIERLIKEGLTDSEIASRLGIEIGSTRFEKNTVKWYKFCLKMKNAHKNLIKKYPNLYKKASQRAKELYPNIYSIAGKRAQNLYPHLGHELGNKYGKIAGKIRMEQLRKSGKMKVYFSTIAKRLQEIKPEHSRNNMRKAIEKMKEEGTYFEHQKLAAEKCFKKHPGQPQRMGERAHELHPDLPIRSLASRRKNSPYMFMGCKFDSNQEREICKLLVRHKLIQKPVEKENVHITLGRNDVDFFVDGKIFIEFHPCGVFGRNRLKNETYDSYVKERRMLLDKYGFPERPLVVVSNLKRFAHFLNKSPFIDLEELSKYSE